MKPSSYIDSVSGGSSGIALKPVAETIDALRQAVSKNKSIRSLVEEMRVLSLHSTLVPQLYSTMLGALQMIPKANKRAGEENKAIRAVYQYISALLASGHLGEGEAMTLMHQLVRIDLCDDLLPRQLAALQLYAEAASAFPAGDPSPGLSFSLEPALSDASVAIAEEFNSSSNSNTTSTMILAKGKTLTAGVSSAVALASAPGVFSALASAAGSDVQPHSCIRTYLKAGLVSSNSDVRCSAVLALLRCSQRASDSEAVARDLERYVSARSLFAKEKAVRAEAAFAREKASGGSKAATAATTRTMSFFGKSLFTKGGITSEEEDHESSVRALDPVTISFLQEIIIGLIPTKWPSHADISLSSNSENYYPTGKFITTDEDSCILLLQSAAVLSGIKIPWPKSLHTKTRSAIKSSNSIHPFSPLDIAAGKDSGESSLILQLFSTQRVYGENLLEENSEDIYKDKDAQRLAFEIASSVPKCFTSGSLIEETNLERECYKLLFAGLMMDGRARVTLESAKLLAAGGIARMCGLSSAKFEPQHRKWRFIRRFSDAAEAVSSVLMSGLINRSQITVASALRAAIALGASFSAWEARMIRRMRARWGKGIIALSSSSSLSKNTHGDWRVGLYGSTVGRPGPRLPVFSPTMNDTNNISVSNTPYIQSSVSLLLPQEELAVWALGCEAMSRLMDPILRTVMLGDLANGNNVSSTDNSEDAANADLSSGAAAALSETAFGFDLLLPLTLRAIVWVIPSLALSAAALIQKPATDPELAPALLQRLAGSANVSFLPPSNTSSLHSSFILNSSTTLFNSLFSPSTLSGALGSQLNTSSSFILAAKAGWTAQSILVDACERLRGEQALVGLYSCLADKACLYSRPGGPFMQLLAAIPIIWLRKSVGWHSRGSGSIIGDTVGAPLGVSLGRLSAVVLCAPLQEPVSSSKSARESSPSLHSLAVQSRRNTLGVDFGVVRGAGNSGPLGTSRLMISAPTPSLLLSSWDLLRFFHHVMHLNTSGGVVYKSSSCALRALNASLEIVMNGGLPPPLSFPNSGALLVAATKLLVSLRSLSSPKVLGNTKSRISAAVLTSVGKAGWGVIAPPTTMLKNSPLTLPNPGAGIIAGGMNFWMNSAARHQLSYRVMRYATYYSLNLSESDPFILHSLLSPASSIDVSTTEEIDEKSNVIQPQQDVENEYENISMTLSTGKPSTSRPSLRAIIVVLSIPSSLSEFPLQLKSLQASKAAVDAASIAVIKAAKRHQATCGSDLSFAEGRHPLYRSALRAGLKCL
jgi:hypothetical protein